MSMLTELTGNILRPAELLARIDVHAARQTLLERQDIVDKGAQLQLTNLLGQIENATYRAKHLVVGRGNADFTKRLESGSWSVAECFDHLAQTTHAFLPAIANAVGSAPRLTTNRALCTGTLAQLFIRNLEPPYRLRFKVLPQIAPQQQDFEAAWSGFLESQARLSETVCSAAGLAIDRVRIKSPVYARISYNVYGAFRILAAHERRHLWQIEQIFKALDRQQA